MGFTSAVELVPGVKWPEIQLPGDIFLHDEDRPWIDLDEYPGSGIKVLYADEATNTVAFLFRIHPHSSFPIHEHTCRAIAYTLEGEWWYGETYQKQGSLAVELPGSVHYPRTREAGMTIFAVLTGEPGGSSVLLRSQDPETLDVVELDVAWYANLMGTV